MASDSQCQINGYPEVKNENKKNKNRTNKKKGVNKKGGEK